MYTFHLEAATAGDDTAAALAALQAAGDAGLPAVHDLIAAVKVRRCWRGTACPPACPRARLRPARAAACSCRLGRAVPLPSMQRHTPCNPVLRRRQACWLG